MNLIYETLDWGRKWLVFNAGKTQLVLFDRSSNTGAVEVKIDGFVLEEKLSCKMLQLTFSSKLDWDSYIISIAKTSVKKIGALICSMKFLSPEVALYLYKSTMWPCLGRYSKLLPGIVGYAGLLVLHLLPFFNHWLMGEM